MRILPENWSPSSSKVVKIIAFGYLVAGIWFTWKTFGYIGVTLIPLLTIIIPEVSKRVLPRFPRGVLFYILPIVPLFASVGHGLLLVSVTNSLIKLNLILALLVFLAMFPVLFQYIFNTLRSLVRIVGGGNAFDSILVSLSFSISLGFLLTVISLVVGIYLSPESAVPNSVQMLFSNAVFDGITVLVTVLILNTFLASSHEYLILVAVLIDLLIAGFLACLSLYFGVIGTSLQLSVSEVLCILWGLDTTCSALDLSPFFWAMHTAFLPTVIYMNVILFCYLGKTVILPIAKVLYKGSFIDKPHLLTASTFGFIAVVFGVIGKALDYFM